MYTPQIIATVNQRVLSLFAKFSDKEFYERQIARRIGIGYGSAHRAVEELCSNGIIKRRQEGRMCFYSIDTVNPILIELKRIINLLLIEPLVEEIKAISMRIILFGSCAQGSDTSESDLDIFIVSNTKAEVLELVNNYKFPQGFEDIHIQAVIQTPIEIMQAKGPGQVFIQEVERGITLWEKAASESRV